MISQEAVTCPLTTEAFRNPNPGLSGHFSPCTVSHISLDALSHVLYHMSLMSLWQHRV